MGSERAVVKQLYNKKYTEKVYIQKVEAKLYYLYLTIVQHK